MRSIPTPSCSSLSAADIRRPAPLRARAGIADGLLPLSPAGQAARPPPRRVVGSSTSTGLTKGLSQLTMSQSLTNAAAWKASELAVDVPATTAPPSATATRDQPHARGAAARPAATATPSARTSRSARSRRRRSWTPGSHPRGHRANLEYPAWTAIGVGAAGGSWGYGWVQDFGVSNPDPIATRWRASPRRRRRRHRPRPVPLASPLAAPAPAPVVAAAPPAAAPTSSHGAARSARAAHGAHPLARLRSDAGAELLAQPARRCGTTAAPAGRCTSTRRHVFRVTVTGPTGTDTQMVRWRVLRALARLRRSPTRGPRPPSRARSTSALHVRLSAP